MALLVRRVRDACDAPDVQCVGTSATMTTEGDAERAAAGRSPRSRPRCSATPVEPGARDRRDAGADHRPGRRSRPGRAARGASATRRRRTTIAAFAADPLATWIEEVFGFEPGSPADSPRRRRRPPTRPRGGAPAGRADRRGPRRRARRRSRTTLQAGSRIVNPATGRPLFAFRLHQFLSKGDNVYVTLEPPSTRHITSTTRSPRQPRPGRRNGSCCRLAFCRECGQEYLAVDPERHGRRATGTAARRRQRRQRRRRRRRLPVHQRRPAVAARPGAGADRRPAAGLLADVSTRRPAARSSIRPGRSTCPSRCTWTSPAARPAPGEGTYAAYHAEPVPVLPALRRLLRAGPRQRLRQAGQLSAEGRSSAMSLITASHRPDAARLPKATSTTRRASCSPSSTTGRTPRCRPGTSTTSSRSPSCAAPCTGRCDAGAGRPDRTRSSPSRSPTHSAWPWPTTPATRTRSTASATRRDGRCAR